MNTHFFSKVTLAWALALILLPTSLLAELTVASPFTNNAVLQRDMPVPVWGTADTGATVTVKFAGQSKSTTTDSKGKWKVQLAPLQSSLTPHVLTITSSKNHELEFSNILVGEVWICSGQSNMQMGHEKVPEIADLLPSAKNLRAFTVANTVAFTKQDTCEGKWVTTPPSSAVAVAFAYFLEKSSNVPVGIIQASWGSSSLEAWMPRELTESVPHFKTMMKEFDADTQTRDRITAILEGPKPWPRQDDIFLRRQTNILYNAMIHPLVPYACRGLVWYQGERNAQSIHGMKKTPWYGRHSGMLKYGDTLKAWMQSYRQEWNREDFQFLIVMLPGYAKGAKGGPENPDNDSWAWIRESQLKALDLPHTAVINTIDLGHATNIHPTDKLPIGKRLAMLAPRAALKKEVVAQGPVLNRVEIEGETLIVHFDQAEGLKTLDRNQPRGFWLANNSAKWVKADAKLSGKKVILSTSQLKKPLYIRYAFAGKPSVNLVNASELPAFPFRTDTFEP